MSVLRAANEPAQSREMKRSSGEGVRPAELAMPAAVPMASGKSGETTALGVVRGKSEARPRQPLGG